MKIKRIVIDVLVPNETGVLAFAEKIGELDKIDGVTIQVIEIDERTKTVEMTIEGDDVHFEKITEAIDGLGGSVHSIDEVSAGSRIIQPSKSRRGKE
ncbi:MAG: DUF211 domain-containing protein [Methanobacteriota archaeon]